jgi:dynein heavy chain
MSSIIFSPSYRHRVVHHPLTIINIMTPSLQGPILENKEDLEDICISAVKEKDIEAKLSAVIKEWSAHVVTFKSFKTRGELKINSAEINELITVMEDSMMILSGLMSNRYNVPFKPQIQQWVKNLSETNDILIMWMQVQNLWEYV